MMKENLMKAIVVLVVLVILATSLGAQFAQADDTALSKAVGMKRLPDYEQIAAVKYGRWTSLGADFA
jgi:hypothetical protein